MDKNMPIMDGFTAAKLIKEFDINQKIVLCSAEYLTTN